MVIRNVALFVFFSVFLVSGCTTKSFFGTPAETYSGNIYQLSEGSALQIAYGAIQSTLPNIPIMETTKDENKGFTIFQTVSPNHDARYDRFHEKDFIYTVYIYSAEGVDPNGATRTGYYFVANGQGNLPTGPDTLAKLQNTLLERFEKTGTVVTITDGKPGQHDPAPIYQPHKDTVQAPVTTPVQTSPTYSEQKPKPEPATVQPAPSKDTFEKLKSLKQLYDQGVIDEEEFEEKKEELLDRL